jgi:hypothetical protein
MTHIAFEGGTHHDKSIITSLCEKDCLKHAGSFQQARQWILLDADARAWCQQHADHRTQEPSESKYNILCFLLQFHVNGYTLRNPQKLADFELAPRFWKLAFLPPPVQLLCRLARLCGVEGTRVPYMQLYRGMSWDTREAVPSQLLEILHNGHGSIQTHAIQSYTPYIGMAVGHACKPGTAFGIIVSTLVLPDRVFHDNASITHHPRARLLADVGEVQLYPGLYTFQLVDVFVGGVAVLPNARRDSADD